MRSSFLPLAFAAGTLALALFEAAPAQPAAGAAAADVPGAEFVLAPRPAPRAATASGAPEAPEPPSLWAEGLAIGVSYSDVFRALKDDNPCSRFFGGPRVAVTVFNELARRLRRRPLGRGTVALLMSGGYTTHRDNRVGASYRLFDEATINSNGPFAGAFRAAGETRTRVGRFPSDTREAKALMLLHELGHLIRGLDGKWLLPDDGGDAALSERNTRAVESRCIQELLALRD